MKIREDKRLVKLEIYFIFKYALFGHILKKSTPSFLNAWSFLLVHIRFTPNEEPKDFVNWFFFKESNHENWTMKKSPLPWSDFMGHGVNRALSDADCPLSLNWGNFSQCSSATNGSTFLSAEQSFPSRVYITTLLAPAPPVCTWCMWI
jgi:hypothetical protein